MKITGILVAYNPIESELISSVGRLSKQCDFVIICNNSDNGYTISESIFPSSSNYKIINFGKNVGIAKAQSVAMKWAFDNDADFIIQMDQDSILEPETIPSLLEKYKLMTSLGYNVGVIGPRHYDKLTKEVDTARLIKGKEIKGTNCEIVHATISSASIISKEAYAVAGPMDNGLFIDSVDWEYCWRLKSLGFVTIRVNNILLGHQVGNGKKKIIGKFDARVPSPIRHYYHTRNLFLLSKRNYVPLYWKVSNYIKLVLKLFLYPFIFKDGKIRFKYICKGISHGIQGKYGHINSASKDYK
ncbi:glycosyltransferase family 2 protein [Proteus mirabilis]|uniref:Glycosyltransferase family 2 protein n=2 Tax=Morganellaceae TaxID=1903414 RepID=A0ABD5LYK9_PROMI|nr:glycosyltransferase family 2 protein [Providencia stuartii]MBO8919107.1 glycosyltransferase family 2 protein [Proteus mirabilis]NMT49439.1 glycosyltransferase family 2 protein [Providencia stuartii]